MTTDTFTLPESDLEDRVAPALPARPEPPTAIQQDVTARLPRLRRGGWGLVRQLLSDDARSKPDHLLLLGPSGGPIGASRLV
jgi:hypothetical protein